MMDNLQDSNFILVIIHLYTFHVNFFFVRWIIYQTVTLFWSSSIVILSMLTFVRWIIYQTVTLFSSSSIVIFTRLELTFLTTPQNRNSPCPGLQIENTFHVEDPVCSLGQSEGQLASRGRVESLGQQVLHPGPQFRGLPAVRLTHYQSWALSVFLNFFNNKI